METPSMGILAVVFNLMQLVSASPTEYAVEHKFSPESQFSSRGTLKCFPSTKLQCSMYDDTNLLKSFESLTINTLPNQEIMSVSLLTPVPTCNGTLAKSLSKRSVSVKTRIEIVDPLTPPE
ncbi:hypothetical protein EB796_011823 [Bugula neritina]|uniref:Uncharacterized protein n=1 Tax=Bugula neritina TaxID=10212 RepID=A0A7J7JX05_BUGNE|nr:hypothetical protein EB796_011823 [Bugula neritina]